MTASIVAQPVRWLAQHYRIHQDGAPWTELRFDAPGGNACFVVDGRSYRAVYDIANLSFVTHLLRSLRQRHAYRLDGDTGPVAHARGEGGMAARYHVWTAEGVSYHVREEDGQVSLLRDGVLVGRFGRRAGLSRGLWGELALEVPGPVRAFVVWLLLRRWETVSTGGGE